MTNERNPLGVALRRWRDRLAPADVGLPRTGGRRAAGLRREELATLAGLSVDYLVRLEQGRATRPSEQVAQALARALQLEAAERDHLYRLAHLPPPAPGRVSTHIPPSVQRLLAGLGDQPLAVFGADWTLLTWTPLWSALLGDPAQIPEGRRNLVLDTFLPPPTRGHWPVRSEGGQDGQGDLEAALVADLRTAEATYPDDPGLHQLIGECQAHSPRFAQLWSQGAVGQHLHAKKTIVHPLVGDVTLDCDVLTVPGADLKIIVYTAPAGSPPAEQLAFLRVTAVNTHVSTDAP
ncbi:helix-turn-helix transcriptional regulator [Sphaerisporangium sp. TRM90804]|uniref:helix-turn-helix transcriptional regulator n=1 Tax=Sphaerisporangium sp. TRM90804 TaxID=3031113 RepID=UPI00244CB8CC|nr:helix-turn-helix transcriptional regulator [Sphaerisporangium sp. TRM90804]MDH2428800.1 helix-turn-helix transcriptional regulator [Sphaerisporangium sp. TRM90804]